MGQNRLDGHGDAVDSSSRGVYKQPFHPGLCINRRAPLLTITLGSQHVPSRWGPALCPLRTGLATLAWLMLVTKERDVCS